MKAFLISILCLYALQPVLGQKPDATDIMDKDSVWVNGKIPYTVSQKELIKQLGKPDSTTRPMYECGGYEEGMEEYGNLVEIYYYNNTQFVAYKDVADIKIIDFSSGKFYLKTPKLTLTSKTTLEEFTKAYPLAAKTARDFTDNGITYKIIQIDPKPFWDDQWMLWFLNGKLVKIKYYISC